MIKSTIFAGALLLTLSSNGHACEVPRFPTLEHQTTTGHMYANSGRPCWIILGGSSGPMHSIRLVQRPAHGETKLNGMNVGYRSRPRFTGNDSFTYAWHGLDTKGRAVVRTVQVIVSVK